MIIVIIYCTINNTHVYMHADDLPFQGEVLSRFPHIKITQFFFLNVFHSSVSVLSAAAADLFHIIDETLF